MKTPRRRTGTGPGHTVRRWRIRGKGCKAAAVPDDQPPRRDADDLDDEQLHPLLLGAKEASGLSYVSLGGAVPGLSKTTVENYLKKPGWGRDRRTLELLLDALHATADLRAQALRLQDQIDKRRTDRSRPASCVTLAGWRARVTRAGCAVWSLDEFTASEATVQTAIGRREPLTGHHGPLDLPPYIPRDFDQTLRAEIAQAAAGELSAMILLRGASSTGKTRSLFEAVRRLPNQPMIIRPQGAAAMRELPAAGLCDRPAVVWLNELQGFLGPDGTGLSRHVLRELFTTATVPLVLVATLWPDKQRDKTTSSGDSASETAQLFEPNPWVRIHDVPNRFTPTELTAARREHHDLRIAAALADPNKLGFTQTLAGGAELLAHYCGAPALTRLLLDAAGDARRLGHRHALPAPLLEAMALALWRDERGPVTPPEDWFSQALDYATRRLRSDDGVQALIPLDDPDTNQSIGYHLVDYLEQHLAGARATKKIPDGCWTALREHVHDPDDLMELFGSAAARARFIHSEALLRTCGVAGLVRLGNWLASPPGRANTAESEDAYRQAVALGAPGGARHLALALGWRPGQEEEVETLYKQAIAEGDVQALDWYAGWLTERPGREDEVEALYWQAAALGDPNGLVRLAGWLGQRPEGKDEAERFYRDAAATGQTSAVHRLADWLTESGRESEAEVLYMEVAATGSPAFVVWVAGWLSRRGQYAEAEKLWLQAALTRDAAALGAYARWLMQRPGRESDSEQRYREAVAAGDLMATVEFTSWLGERGRHAEAEPLWQQALAEGNTHAIASFADWLHEEGREVEAEAQWRKAAHLGDAHAIHQLAYLLAERQRPQDEIEALWRQAVTLGVLRTLSQLRDWLTGQGRHSEADTVWQHGLDADGATAWPEPGPPVAAG
jgi:hypothetical protein